jgi:hypothetical protein
MRVYRKKREAGGMVMVRCEWRWIFAVKMKRREGSCREKVKSRLKKCKITI